MTANYLKVALLPGIALALSACGGGDSGGTTETPTPVVVADVSIAPVNRTLYVGETQLFEATVKDASGKVITGRNVVWSTNTSAVATVSNTGLVTAIGTGQTLVSATVDGKKGNANVSVIEPVSSVQIDLLEPVVRIGQSVQLEARALGASGATLSRIINWTSSNTGVLNISTSGMANGVSPGSAVVTATADGITSQATVGVSSIASTTMNFGTVVIPMGETEQLSLTGRDAQGTVLSPLVTSWSSNNTNTATVSPSGLVQVKPLPPSVTFTITGKFDGLAASQEFFTFPRLFPNDPWVLDDNQLGALYGWTVRVAPGTQRMVVTLSGGNGNPDLALYAPTLTLEEFPVCVSEAAGPNDTCEINAPAPGVWVVGVYTQAAYANVSLAVSFPQASTSADATQSPQRDVARPSLRSFLQKAARPVARR